jgi:hypothetical protein
LCAKCGSYSCAVSSSPFFVEYLSFSLHRFSSLSLRLSYYFAHAFSVRGTRRNLGLQQPMVTDQCGMGWSPGLVGHFAATWTGSRPLDVDHLTNRSSQPLAAVLKRLKDEL